MEAQDNKIIEIPSGDGKEDFKIRKQIILQFYQDWKKKNPSLKRYNLSLKDFINIRFVIQA